MEDIVSYNKKDIADFCREIIYKLDKYEDNGIRIWNIEKRPITTECDKELKEVDGAMVLVGDTRICGEHFELRVDLWK